MNYDSLIANSLFFSSESKDSESLVKINIGCGPNIFPFDGWVNYDHAESLNNYWVFMKNNTFEN